jgi:4,5-DOPA dioxygenase extradiol
MKRKDFIKSSLSLMAISSLSSFKTIADLLPEQDEIMPALFIGHGNPMNAIEDNEFSKGWKNIAAKIPKPKAILCVSAHWETNGTFVTNMQHPQTIHDFGGFPKALFDVQYPAPGSEWLAKEIQTNIASTAVHLDNAWGFDHGCWSVLKNLYPDANIPTVQLSLDATQDANYHYNLAKELQALRKKGVLIIGSGNMVHNFQYAVFNQDFNKHFGHEWAIKANEDFKKFITDGNHQALINYKKESKELALSAPTPEHYLPLLYTLGLQTKKDKISIFNDAVVGGSFSMTSLLLENSK